MTNSTHDFELELVPPSDTPYVKRRSRAYAVEAIKRWFFHNFEDPVHETPWDEGEYVYIWGGPYNARDVIEEYFDGEVSDATMQLAIAAIEEEGILYWAPHGRRIQPKTIRAPARKRSSPKRDRSHEIEKAHKKMLAALSDVDKEFGGFRPVPAGIGHNRPPEPIAAPVLDGEDLSELREAVGLLRRQPRDVIVDLDRVKKAAQTLGNAASKVLAYCAKQADNFVTEAVKEGGKWLVKGSVLGVAAKAAAEWLRAQGYL